MRLQRTFKERLISRLCFYLGVMAFLFLLNRLQSMEQHRLFQPAQPAELQAEAGQ